MAAAAAPRHARSHHLDPVLASVFPPKIHTTPTPEATPTIGVLASPGATFGGFNLPSSSDDQAHRQNRAWSAATRFLVMPPSRQAPIRDLVNSPDAESALGYLLSSITAGKDLMDWYMHEVSTHFQRFVLPELSCWQQPVVVEDAVQVLSQTVAVLHQAQSLYVNIAHHDDSALANKLQSFLKSVKRELHVLVWNFLPRQRVEVTLASYLYQSMKNALTVGSNPEICIKNGRCRCELGLDEQALNQLRDIGFGGSHGERALAHAVHKLLSGPAIERRCFQVDWTEETCVMARVIDWANSILGPAIAKALSVLSGDISISPNYDQLTSAAISSFGRLRVRFLFDYVSSWPASQGAVDDIKEYLRADGSGQKAFLCGSFSEQVQRRLLHAGASTTEILSMYISIIHVFKHLDSRGVLLEKVAIPVRSYLRSREDTASTIAASLLADVDVDGNVHGHDAEKVCTDITIEIAKSTVDAHDERIVNWDDMSWMPDPIDAGPNYKSTKSDDVVAYILGLFDQDDFVKALSAAFGHHLIRSKDTELIKELRLVELLKSRLDATKLQQAEVMLKDMRDSMLLNKRINPDQYKSKQTRKPSPKDIQAALPDEGITIHSLYALFKDRMDRKEFQAALQLVAKRRNDLYFPKRTRLPLEAKSSPRTPTKSTMFFEAKVLSSYFWPPLRDVDFRIPKQAAEHMERYEHAFASISGQRKLDWKHALGTTKLKLELEDRVIEEEGVEVWKASVIDAFASPDHYSSDVSPGHYDPAAGLTLSDLMGVLNMEEDYAMSGINFWLSKRVLYEKAKGRYAVLERLDMDMAYVEDDTQIDVEAISAVKSEDAMLRENAPTYQNFIDGMLRNSGPKEIGGFIGITNMLKMVMPTFAGGDAEIRWLLEDMKSRGAVTQNGELWSVV